jgi:hypothetical protein
MERDPIWDTIIAAGSLAAFILIFAYALAGMWQPYA